MGCGASSGGAAAANTYSPGKAAAAAEELEDSPTIWVGNIPAAFGNVNELGLVEALPLTEREIKEAFKEYGDVVNVTLRKKGGEFDEKSWALVTFTDVLSARRALKGDTVVIDSAFDEVTLQVKRAQVGDHLSTNKKGALGAMAAQQSKEVKKREAVQKRAEKRSGNLARGQAARQKRNARKAGDGEGSESDSGSEGEDPPPRRNSKRASLRSESRSFGNKHKLKGGESFVERTRHRRVSTDGGGSFKKREKTLGKREQKEARRNSMQTKDEVSKEVDKQAAWNTAWVGGIPLEYLQQGKAELKVLRLLKGFGRVVRVTVRKKKEPTVGDYKSWAFVTFSEARAVSMAMRDGVELEEYGVQLRIEPADIEGELEKNGQGALGKKWMEQQAKVQAELTKKEVSKPPARKARRASVNATMKDEPSQPRSQPRGRRGSVIGVKYEFSKPEGEG